MRVCSTEYVFHALINEEAVLDSILDRGLRPLSDFPDSDRWRQIQEQVPGMFESIYRRWGEPIVGEPYRNSGIFLSPIDFRLLPGTALHAVTRIRIPVARLDSARSFLMYELDGERVTLPVTPESLERVAEVWTAERVRAWFGRDPSRIFYYVPQVATYPLDGVEVLPEDVETFTAEA